MLLQCSLMLPNGLDEFDIAEYKVEIQVEDVTRADAPAQVVGQGTFPARTVGRSGRRLGPIRLLVTLPDPDASYNVRALLTRGLSLAEGDMLSTRSIPIAATASEATIEIPLTLVT
jgi:hypothetical protein